MSDKFICCRIDRLLTWILEEEKTGYVFGIHKDLFFVPKTSDVFKTERYGHPLETPIGVAAGPHTQLAQNIISAWLTGARTIELKTIQVLDELDVTKPCIDMEDEGYNCEWSQELKLEKSFNEYLNAWILLHVLKDKFGWGDPKIPGFIFNMSVGYNLEGIQSKGVQRFLDKMEDCSREKAEKIDILSDIYPRIRDLDISNCVSDNITVSTMHGCPPDEIEKIGQYFIEKRKLNTIIKLNPTLLGPDRLRDILNNKLGYKIVVPDEAFAHDLKFDAALRLIKNLLASAKKSGVEFGLKLTNTLETENSGQNLPEHEARVYMSGRALHAISVNVAAKLQRSFKGQLDVSFCAGVDCYNVSDVLACNMTPVTICSDLLKPGGYGRLSQYLEEIETSFKLKNTSSIDDHIKSTATSGKETAEAGLENLIKYADDVISNPSLHKDAFPYTTIKTDRELTVFDCTHAPCVSTCPAEQNIPAYIRQTAKGDYQKAHQVILQTNPFPNVLGSVCHHPCQNKCTRMNYDTPLMIREIKRFIACKNRKQTRQTPPPTTGHKAAIIGAGPSGLTCARYLALSGFSVDVFETKAFPGGMASDAIPSYRLDDESLKKDIDSITDLGVKIHYNSQVDKSGFDKIRQTYDFVYIAVGAQDYVKLGIPGEDADGIIDQLSFLSDVRRENRPDIGKKVAVIGGGNSALDAARTAMRLVGKDGEVILLYRRTRKEMPADLEEIKAADNEGVKIIELIAPEEIITENGKVSAIDCSRMTLG
ncbi:FAD-dependent oxidoreductase, partial [bacterium]|nr:FAD-dependent oxidoreductase [bacterium]